MYNSGVANKSTMVLAPHINADGSYSIPLIAIGGELAAAAATANQALTAAAPAGQFAYITDYTLTCTATAAVSASVSLLDASGGNVIDKISFAATGPTASAPIVKRFMTPHRTAAAGGQFFITTTGAAVTWSIQVNGYFSSIL